MDRVNNDVGSDNLYVCISDFVLPFSYTKAPVTRRSSNLSAGTGADV